MYIPSRMNTNNHHGCGCAYHLICIFRGFHRCWVPLCWYNHCNHPCPMRDWHFIIATDVDSSSVCMQFLGKKITSSLIVPYCNWSFFADCGPLMVTITRRQKNRMLDTVHDLLDCNNLYPYFINSWRVVRKVLLRGWTTRLGEFLGVARFGICRRGPVYRE